MASKLAALNVFRQMAERYPCKTLILSDIEGCDPARGYYRKGFVITEGNKPAIVEVHFSTIVDLRLWSSGGDVTVPTSKAEFDSP